MKPTGQRITDRYPHLRDGAARRQMLVRNAVASAQIESIRADEARLRAVVEQAAAKAAESL